MESTIPECLSPLITNHPASCAYRITLSSHEWTWTQKEQEEMAKMIVALDRERIELRRVDLGALRGKRKMK